MDHDTHEQMPLWLEEKCEREYHDWYERQIGKRSDGVWCLNTYREARRIGDAQKTQEYDDA